MNTTKEKNEYSKAELIQFLYFMASGFGFAYWLLFLVLHPLTTYEAKLVYMTIPYSIVGLGLIMVFRDAYRNKHYFLSLHFYAGLLVAGFMA